MKLDLSKSCLTSLKRRVLRVYGVFDDKNNIITSSCEDKTLDTRENRLCLTCLNDGEKIDFRHKKTHKKNECVYDNENITICNNRKNIAVGMIDTLDTGKIGSTSTSPIDPDLNPCFLCGGLNFIHGENGGYFCTICQPDVRQGYPVRSGF